MAAGSRNLFAFERATSDEVIMVAVNFASTPTNLRVRTGSRWEILFDTHNRTTVQVSSGDQLTLGPHEAVIFLAD